MMGTNDLTENGERHWHCWVYTSEETLPRFLHGYAAPSYASPPLTPSSQHLCSGSIKEWYSALSSKQFEVLVHSLDNGCLDTTILGIDKLQIEIRFSQTSIQNALGSTAVQVDSYYSLDNREYELTRDNVLRVFGHLHWTTDHDGPEQFMHRLGTFDILHMPQTAEDDEPIVDIRLPFRDRPPTGPEKRNQFEIKRRQDIADQLHVGHVRLYCGKTPLQDSLYSLQPGCALFGPITTKDEFDRVQFWMFAEDGSLVHHEDSNWINVLSFQTSIQGHTVNYTDTLAERAKGTGDKDKLRNLSHVSIHSPEKPRVLNLATNNGFRQYHREMDERGKALFRSPSSARWFPKGISGSVDALLHLKTLIEQQGNKSSLIVDPFFDSKALECIVPRIGLRGIKLTIITNLRNIDPGTGVCTSSTDQKPIEILKQKLEQLRPLIHCDLRVINLLKADGSTEQIFHDRYLCLEPNDGKPTIYLLSNSMNAFAENYPFCMSKMDGEATENVYEYISGLTKIADPISGKELHCDFEWSKNER